MKAERFEALAEAHGGAIARWPAAEQDAAYAFLARDPATADAALARARALDEALDLLSAPPVPAALRDRILAQAPRPRAAGALRRWLAGAGIGLGLAAATAAGVAAGVGLTAAAPPSDDAMLAQIYGPGELLDESGVES